MKYYLVTGGLSSVPEASNKTVYCFSLKMRRTYGNTQEFFVCSLNRLSPVVNINGRKDGGQH